MSPRVCVVVAAYNRAWLLPALVEALSAQTLEDFEALLVDNGSADDTRATLEQLTADDPRLRVLPIDDNRGPARARNLAWRSTEAPWVAFTDDDCAPEPAWLEELLRAGEEADLVQGETRPVEHAPGRPRWFDRSQRIYHFSDRFETCNLLVRRSWLERLDGFDETFHIAMGEDTDFGLRAVAAGAVTAFAPRAVVRHHVWRAGFGDYLKQRRRWAEQVELMRVNPAARRHLTLGFVGGGTHLMIYGLVPLTAGAVAVGHAWIPGVVALGWCVFNAHRSRYKPFPWPARVAYSALELVGRVYETACFVAMSVRYRTLVL